MRSGKSKKKTRSTSAMLSWRGLNGQISHRYTNSRDEFRSFFHDLLVSKVSSIWSSSLYIDKTWKFIEDVGWILEDKSNIPEDVTRMINTEKETENLLIRLSQAFRLEYKKNHAKWEPGIGIVSPEGKPDFITVKIPSGKEIVIKKPGIL